MDSFWKSALEAAEKAKSVAKAVSQKGIEFAETTAEEASKRFKDLGLHDAAVAHITPKQNAPTDKELASYGITSAFIEFVRCLNYNAFREHPLGNPNPNTSTDTDTAPAPAAPVLNAWQLRHATLIVRAVKEVNELRYVLCPRYMDDETFWHVYFSLSKEYLPDITFLWNDGDYLPPVSSMEQQEDRFMSFDALGSQLRSLSHTISSAASAAAANSGPAGVQLAAILKRDTGVDVSSNGDTTQSDVAVGNTSSELPKSLLGVDPDLEAYLQDVEEEEEDDDDGLDEESKEVISSVMDELKIERENKSNASHDTDQYGSTTATQVGDGHAAAGTATTLSNTNEGADNDIDLDKYLNELSKEIDDGGSDGFDGLLDDDVDDGDVDAVLRQLQIDVGDDDGDRGETS